MDFLTGAVVKRLVLKAIRYVVKLLCEILNKKKH